MRLFSFRRSLWSGDWKRPAVVLLSVIGSTGMALGLRVFLNDGIPFLPFTLAVVVSSVYGGLYSGLAATVLCFAIADYYFIEPLHTFFPLQPGEITLLILFLVVGITISLLHSKLAAANEALVRTKQRNKLAAEIGRIGFAEFTPPDRLVWTAETEKLFGLEAGTFEGTYGAWMKRIHAEDRERIDKLRNDCIARRVPEMTYSYRAGIVASVRQGSG